MDEEALNTSVRKFLGAKAMLLKRESPSGLVTLGRFPGRVGCKTVTIFPNVPGLTRDEARRMELPQAASLRSPGRDRSGGNTAPPVAVSDALSWWGIIWSARPARVCRRDCQ
jgi:hypothetical protein